MALEKTVLSQQSICDLLKQKYDITVTDIKRLPLGSANCYRISDGRKNYFLKELQSKFSVDTIAQEANLVNFLAQGGIPVARFYKTLQNETAFTYEGHVICLEDFVDGQAYGYDDMPELFLPKVAEMLGKIHAVLKDYDLPTDMGEDWIAAYSAQKLAGQYTALLNDAQNTPDDKNFVRITQDLQYKSELAYRLSDCKKFFDGITYTASHGDYQGCQVIFDGCEIKAVIDFSSARALPVVWEIMRSFTQTSQKCRTFATIDVHDLCEYVQRYMKYAPLTERDMLAMPYVYLFQLARSKFGYPQYLNSDTEDRNGLLDFAFWRTDMCRELENKAEFISSELIRFIYS